MKARIPNFRNMAKACTETIRILRETARVLENSVLYQWGHMGACNCGFLAQQISHLGKDEIHARAMEQSGDWNQQLVDYCPSSGLRMDDLISTMLNAGFSINDLKHLERLSDPAVLRTLPLSERYLHHNIREDVVKYFRTWADLLETELLDNIGITLVLNALLPVQRQVVE